MEQKKEESELPSRYIPQTVLVVFVCWSDFDASRFFLYLPYLLNLSLLFDMASGLLAIVNTSLYRIEEVQMLFHDGNVRRWPWWLRRLLSRPN